MNRFRIIVVAMVATVALTAGAVGALAGPNAGDGKLEINAMFVDAGAIIQGNDVKVDGVKVGSVRGIEVVDGVAKLTFSVSDAASPLFSDATATVRPVSLLGERYIDVHRGTPTSEVLLDGATIPVERTGRSVDLDEVLDAVDDPTGTALAALLTSLGDGMAGRGSDVAETLAVLEPALTKTDALIDLLADQNAVLTSLIDNMAPVAKALGGNGGAELDALVDTTNELLDATANRAPELKTTLSLLPQTVTVAREALQQLRTLADSTAPAVASLKPLTQDFESFSNELQAFVDVANPALAALEPVLIQGDQLLRDAAPVAAELRAAAPTALVDAQNLEPIADELLGNIDAVLSFLRNWALVTNGSDGLSHYFRAFVVASGGDATGLPLQNLLPTAPTTTARTAPTSPLAPLLGPVTDTLGGVTGALDTTLNSLLGGGSATGLNATQERNLLQSLLGGGQ